jgi:hypothetical protein
MLVSNMWNCVYTRPWFTNVIRYMKTVRKVKIRESKMKFLLISI